MKIVLVCAKRANVDRDASFTEERKWGKWSESLLREKMNVWINIALLAG